MPQWRGGNCDRSNLEISTHEFSEDHAHQRTIISYKKEYKFCRCHLAWLTKTEFRRFLTIRSAQSCGEFEYPVIFVHIVNKNIFARIASFSAALLLVPYRLLMHRPEVVHVHVSVEGELSLGSTSLVGYTSRSVFPLSSTCTGTIFDEFFDEAPKTGLECSIRKTLEHSDVVVGFRKNMDPRDSSA